MRMRYIMIDAINLYTQYNYHAVLLQLLNSIFFSSKLHLYSRPLCITVTTSACNAVFPQSYYLPVAGREENETFAIVAEISDQLDIICRNALNFYACYFIYPPCDLDTGMPDSHKHTFCCI